MGNLEGPNIGDIAQYPRNFRLRRQQFQGAYGASRHKRWAGGSGGSNGSADEAGTADTEAVAAVPCARYFSRL